MNLADYEAAKFEFADILRSAVTLSGRGPSDTPDDIRDVFSRLAEDRFNLVVVGRFNRGKTSLMNAILETDRLPTGIVPLTSVVTAVSYGTREEAFVRFEGNRQLASRISLGQLTDYITQEGNPGNEKRVAVATVRLPNDLLRHGLNLVDTPGLGSAIAENTRTTERFLPEADAFMLVSSYDSPLSEEEMILWRRIAPAKAKLFLVLNKQDLVAASEKERIDSFVRARLVDLVSPEPVRVFSVSALAALNGAASVESGVPALRDTVLNFLIGEKQDHFLFNMGNRVAAIVNRLPNASALLGRLSALRARIGTAAGPAASAWAPEKAAPIFFACEICEETERDVFNYLARHQYDLATDDRSREELTRRGGFCAFHTWQYYALASPQGICLAFPPVLDRVARQLRDIATGEARMLHPDHGDREASEKLCSVCEHRHEREQKTLEAVVARLGRWAQGGPMPSLCLPHTGMLVSQMADEDAIRRLISWQAAICERVVSNMRRYALKFDGTRRHLATDDEIAAAHAALAFLAGKYQVTATRDSR